MSRSGRYAEIFDEFQQNYPRLAYEVVDWWASGRTELTIILEGNQKVYYDWMSKTVNVRRKNSAIDIRSNDVEEFTDAWRSEFGSRLSKRLYRKGISQKEFAEMIGKSAMTVSKYISCKTIPDALTITLMADVLECSVAELIDF